MKAVTIQKDYFKEMNILAVKNDRLTDLKIKNSCYALIIISEGSVTFEVGGKTVEATAPCFVCFDERLSPEAVKKRALRCDSVYFEPSFLNAGMTFDRLHNEHYGEIADIHDYFLLMPFTDDTKYVFSIFDEDLDGVKKSFASLEHDLREQSDWYWTCRARSYFMDLLYTLERSFGYIGEEEIEACENISNRSLERAILFIEENYAGSISLSDITAAAAISHSVLTGLFHDELETTPIEYLWSYRVKMAKNRLEYTSLPIKEISEKCGFKTVQHFTRKFEEVSGESPKEFRDRVKDRKKGGK